MHVSNDTKIAISKSLSWVLRHGAIKIGLKISEDGWVKVDDILKIPKLTHTISFDLIKAVVDENDKKRYELKKEAEVWYIRAVQGHSIKEVHEEGLMDLITNPAHYPVVTHGTFAKNWDSIFKNGLKRMSRNHIHLAPGYPEDGKLISGMRTTCSLFIEIDMAKAMADGAKFYLSKNNVILSEGFDGVFDKVIR